MTCLKELAEYDEVKLKMTIPGAGYYTNPIVKTRSETPTGSTMATDYAGLVSSTHTLPEPQ